LLVEILRKLGASVIKYIPNRYDEGYGLNKEAILSLAQQEVRLIVTVDCGDRPLRRQNMPAAWVWI